MSAAAGEEAAPGATGLSKPVHVFKEKNLLYIYIFIYIYIIYIECSSEPRRRPKTGAAGKCLVVLAGSGGDGAMAHGGFGWTQRDLAARGSPWPWEAFRGCLYLWKSLKK